MLKGTVSGWVFPELSVTQNRWDLVKDGTVHLECGPNTITVEREQEYGIQFSKPFFVTATQVFVKAEATEETLQTGTIGIIKGTTNEQEFRLVYPDERIDDSFERRSQGIAAVQLQEIDGFASDGVLLSGELDRQSLAAENYQLIPEEPLTCDFYGLLLPVGDREWRNLVNAFLRSEQQRRQRIAWLGDYFPKTLSDADYCLNRKNK